jgi:hypothetical protein
MLHILIVDQIVDVSVPFHIGTNTVGSFRSAVLCFEYYKMDTSQERSIFKCITVMHSLTKGIRSEKWVLMRFRRCANVIECTYTNLDSVYSVVFVVVILHT